MQIKDYTKFLGESYKKAYNKIQNKYLAAAGAVDKEYEAEAKRINANAYKSKNDVSASGTISLLNARNSLLDKGLERSGDAVNTEIRSALSRNRALADIDIETNRAHQENALSKMNKKSALMAKRLEEEGALEIDALKQLTEQNNLDREYERKVLESEEDTRRWNIENEEDTRRWNIENEQNAQRDKRDHEFEKEKFEEDKKNNTFENELKEKQFLEQKQQNDFDNYMAEKEYSLSERQQNSSNGSSSSGKTSGNNNTFTYEGHTYKISPKELMKIIVSSNTTDNKKQSRSKIKSIVISLLNDTSISAAYKSELGDIAFAMGYMD